MESRCRLSFFDPIFVIYMEKLIGWCWPRLQFLLHLLNLSTVFVSTYYSMSTRDGLVLGSVMDTKVVLALIILNEARSLQVYFSLVISFFRTNLNFMLIWPVCFSQAIDNNAMVLLVFIIITLAGPIYFLINKTRKRCSIYKVRACKEVIETHNSESRRAFIY